MRKVIHPGFPNYFIRDDGLVERRVDGRRHQKAGLVLYGRVLASGYRQFNLRDGNGCKRLVRGNRLVCEAFHGPAPTSDHHAAHRNGVRLDNVPPNLYWATATENKRDSIMHGTAVRGERTVNQHGPAKLTESAIHSIRAEYTGTRGDLVRIAAMFGVYPSCIHKIVSGQTWAHVPGRSALDIKRQAEMA
jgi:hypothetical protein